MSVRITMAKTGLLEIASKKSKFSKMSRKTSKKFRKLSNLLVDDRDSMVVIRRRRCHFQRITQLFATQSFLGAEKSLNCIIKFVSQIVYVFAVNL